MIKANLLPNAKAEQQNKVFGLQIEGRGLFKAIVTIGLCAIILVAFNLTLGSRVAERQQELDQTQTQLQALSKQTNTVGLLSSNVHRLQEIDRDSEWLKLSGQQMALRMAYIGNAVPKGAWIERMTQDDHGWQINGGGRTLEQLAVVIRGLSHASPGQHTSFKNVGNSHGFDYKILIEPPSVPSPTPAPVNVKLEQATGGFAK